MPTQFKDSRNQCYTARDRYWECLDSNNEDQEKCQNLRKAFESSCLNQWVQHFDRKRKYEKFKQSAASSINSPLPPSYSKQ